MSYEVKVYNNGDREWLLNGCRHRENGPSIEYADGSKFWYLNDKRHREDGPAIERVDGSKEWWINGYLHREDGPAVECANGNKEWWINDRELTEEEFLKRKPDPCDGKAVEIDGKKHSLIS